MIHGASSFSHYFLPPRSLCLQSVSGFFFPSLPLPLLNKILSFSMVHTSVPEQSLRASTSWEMAACNDFNSVVVGPGLKNLVGLIRSSRHSGNQAVNDRHIK